MDLKELNILGNKISNHWYYRSKAKAVTQLLGRLNVSTILDIGAGSGYFSRYLLKNSLAKESWCVDISYNNELDTEEAGKPIYFRRSINSVNADLVLLMDVLEHVDDDVALLKDYVNKVPRGTLFLISVPAFHFLWSKHDIFLGHKRRYKLSQIEDVIKRANLTLKYGTYYFGTIFPIVATTRIIEKILPKSRQQACSHLRLHHPVVNEILAALSFPELLFIKRNRLVGLTAFCLAES